MTNQPTSLRSLLAVLLPLTAIPACGSSTATGDGGGTVDMAGGGSTDGPAATGFTTIFTIVLENHDYKEIVGSPNAPYINSLIANYGLATNYKDSLVHPSLPNYLDMISGDPQYSGGVDVNPNGGAGGVNFPVDMENLGHQLQKAGFAWRAYQESMGLPCTLTNNGKYAPKHDPFLYFDNIQNGPDMLCAKTSVDYKQFAADLAAGTYRYMFITPNLDNDGHDPFNDPVAGLKQSDTWCSNEIPKILASPSYQAGGILFLTWDEAEGRNGNSPDQIPMIVISPKIKSKGFQSATAFSHASYLATVEDLFSLPRLGAAAQAKSLAEFFK